MTSCAAARRLAPVIAGLLAVLSSCAEGGSSARTAACPTRDGGAGDPVSIDVRWSGSYWDEVGGEALVERWDLATPGVDVTVREPTDIYDSMRALLDRDASTLSRVPAESVTSLAAAGLIRPLPDCGTARDGTFEIGTLLDEADRRWARAGSVGAVVMIYDRAAFVRAGLDPERPPRTWQDVAEAARALRDGARMPRPIAGLWPSILTLTEPQLSDDPPPALRAIIDLHRQGFVLPPPEPGDLAPLGDGSAAIQLIGEGDVWGYGTALAKGQAPGADLALAPLPGDRSASVPIVGTVWVISADATDQEAGAASALVDWLRADEQQAALHEITDLVPSSVAAAESPLMQQHWSEVPLFADYWRLVAEHGTLTGRWGMLPGLARAIETETSEPTAPPVLNDGWAKVVAAANAGLHNTDPAALLDCIYAPDGLVPLTRCVD